MLAEQRTREWLALSENAVLTEATAAPLLDLGCGTGELLAILAGRGIPAIGIDIAMRWLVQARRRSALAGGEQLLVCCNAEQLPFPDESFGAAVSMGLFEHCSDPTPIAVEAHRTLRSLAPLRVRTVNRYGQPPEPHVNVWGIGLLPRRLANAYVHWRSGARYLHHRPISAAELRAALAGAGFQGVEVTAAAPLSSEIIRLPPPLRKLASVY